MNRRRVKPLPVDAGDRSMVLAMTSSDNVFRALELQGMTSIGGRVDYLREISAAQLVAVLAKNNLVIRCEAVN